MSLIEIEIRKMIEKKLDAGDKDFIIFPFGDVGYKVKQILNSVYDIQEMCVCDNHLSKYNKNIKPLKQIMDSKEKYINACVLLSSINHAIYRELKEDLSNIFSDDRIVELECMLDKDVSTTICGKYTFGPLKNHPLVESVGAFCSFAYGADVVSNHAMEYITTHPMLYKGNKCEALDDVKYSEYAGCDWFFPGVEPRGFRSKYRKTRIGNDVWLGKNVIITNGAYIGNGVIAGAGSIITKDVPDYAIIAGNPARIIRYRYGNQHIAALNRIAWWNWSDEDIRERFDDFYLPIEKFIKKYDISCEN